MVGRRRVALIAGTLLASVCLVSASATTLYSFFAASFTATYPASHSDDNVLGGRGNTCQLCHQRSTGGNGWNGYGWAVRGFWEQGQTIEMALASVEAMNSDGDPGGATNLQEITAGTQPGWTDGPTNTIYFQDGSTLTGQFPPEGILGSLDPFVCQPDLGSQGPGAALATLCGLGLNEGESSDYIVSGLQPNATGALLVSLPNQPNLTLFPATQNPGVLVSGTGLAGAFSVVADGNGTLTFTVPGLSASVDLVFQSLFLDASVPDHNVTFSNAVLAQFGQ